MSLWALLVVALGLSADAFAVAVGKGLSMPRLSLRGALSLAAAFGVLQAVMPVVGCSLGAGLAGRTAAVDHWLVPALLVGVGARMVREAVAPDGVTGPAPSPLPAGPGSAGGSPLPAGPGSAGGSLLVLAPAPVEGTRVPAPELLLLALATSVDALAVGLGFALLDVGVLPAAALIGVVTFVLSLAGVAVGRSAGLRWRTPAGVAGGVVLIGMGLQVLLEHLLA